MKRSSLLSGRQAGLVAVSIFLCLALAISGCGRRVTARAAAPHPANAPAAARAKPSGHPVRPKSLAFTQDGLHNCGTIAMLISWAHAYPHKAAELVRRQNDGSYLVAFQGVDAVSVTHDDLATAAKARLVRSDQSDPWARVVLTAFVKLKCANGPMDFRSTDWIFAGEIAALLTGAQPAEFDIKPESIDARGRIEVGKPIALSTLKEKLKALRGKPVVAYTNRRVHIWAVLDHDTSRWRVRIRNPRSSSSEWVPLSEFIRKFQLLVYAAP